MSKETKTPNQAEPANHAPLVQAERLVMPCDCFPKHCEKFDEHGKCWCEPTIQEFGENLVIIHNEEQ